MVYLVNTSMVETHPRCVYKHVKKQKHTAIGEKECGIVDVPIYHLGGWVNPLQHLNIRGIGKMRGGGGG